MNIAGKKGIENPMITTTRASIQQIAGIVLLAAGWGWVGGNFTPSNAPLWNFLLHCISIVILLILSIGFFRAPAQVEGSQRGWIIGLHVFSVITLIALIVLIILGQNNPDPNAVGVKTLADWVPTTIVGLGAIVWLTTLLPVGRSHTATSATE